jgi:hypothetical protein
MALSVLAYNLTRDDAAKRDGERKKVDAAPPNRRHRDRFSAIEGAAGPYQKTAA